MTELADIIAPIAPPPAPPPYGWIALGVALLALVLFFVLRLWLKRTRARRWARAALKRTERELQSGKLDARAAAFQIARALSQAHPPSLHPQGVRRWVPRCFAATLPQPFKGRARVGMGANALSTEAWSKFIQALDRARFSPHPIDIQHATQLLAQARQWVGRVS